MGFESMTPEELEKVIEDASGELRRRQNMALLDDRLAEVQDEFRDAKLLPVPPVKWQRPGEIRDAYGRGDVVDAESGKREATAGFVVCSPKCDDHWTDFVEVETTAAAGQGSGPDPEIISWSSDAGRLRVDTLVEFRDKVYRVTSDHKAREEWAPPAMPGLFEEVQHAEVS